MTAEKTKRIKAVLEECRNRGVTVDDLLELLERAVEEESPISMEEAPLEKRITQILKEFGIPPSIKGYYYIHSSVTYVIEHGIDVPMLKELYPAVAKKYGTTPLRVERAMRHAIEVAWERGNIEMIEELFGYTISSEKGKPTNGEFIFMLSEYLKPHE